MRKTICLLLTSFLAATMTVAQKLLPYQDYTLSPEQRADDLISRLTLEEKSKLMIDQSEAIERLGIPQFQWWNEALHGIGRNGFTTVFPITMGMASSWNDTLLERCFNAASDEARVKYMQARRSGAINRYQCLSFWTPNINIFRDPRWGRGQETYGEDPYLTSRMGLAVVRGLQGPKDSKYMKLLACAKHFAVHSGPEWNRHSFNIESLPERDLWETYLPAFKALVQKGNVAEVMCAYQRIDGEPCCGNNRYLQQILRQEWGFKGIVVSDCWALRDFYAPNCHNFTKDATEAAAKAIIAGTDAECGPNYLKFPEAVKRGDVTEETINASLKRLLVARFRLGEMDPDNLVPWTKIPETVVCSKEHSDLALEMARQSIVLLKNAPASPDTKNSEGILPLTTKKLQALASASSSNKRMPVIAVIGPNANDSVMQWGNYSGYPTHTVTLLQGIKDKTANVKYVTGSGHSDNTARQSHFNRIFTADGRQGMEATYWNNTKMEGEPVATKIHTEAITLNNGGATVFAPGVELENFTGKYHGIYRPTEEGKVAISIEADDGFRLKINGEVVADRFSSAHGVQKRTRELDVKPGEEYDIEVDYLQLSGMAHFTFDIHHDSQLSHHKILSQLSDADIVVFVGGISPRLEGEEMKVDAHGFKGGDRTDIELPECQRELIKLIHESGKHIVYINCSGSAVALVQENDICDAVLQAWYPGERGGEAVADILFGKVSPSGKLPITFYRSVNDLPDFCDYTMKNRTYRYFTGIPLWSFGYGMSYTTFNLGKPKYKANAVTLTVRNTGSADGTETIQVYLRHTADKEGPLRSLRAYKRVQLKAGEQQNVSISLPDEAFEVWDTTTNTMRILPGTYEIMVGTSSRSEDLQSVFVKRK